VSACGAGWGAAGAVCACRDAANTQRSTGRSAFTTKPLRLLCTGEGASTPSRATAARPAISDGAKAARSGSPGSGDPGTSTPARAKAARSGDPGACGPRSWQKSGLVGNDLKDDRIVELGIFLRE